MEPQPGVLDILAQFCQRLVHWGPVTALLIIKFIFLTSLYVTSMWLSPYGSTLGTINHAVFIGWVGVLLYNFFMAVAMGPGFVPLKWRPLKIIVRNETTIENWIVAKAQMRERENEEDFIYPYNLGVAENLKQVFFTPLGDGITWPVVPGCNQYTLTVEQILQKHDKRLRTRLYTVVQPYRGSFFPISHGCTVCMTTPLTDEPRIAVSPGDRVLVTRWKK
ncbi:hypothetical protein V5799_019037 [Amblyomma americanum]|uniref:Uncharacterized protein n=1 Tax=Amblyomma americanum TaxID=6943 RepID=A0AAQ4EYG0_AMBAM